MAARQPGKLSVVQQSPWPQSLYLVRPGESAGNVARDKAEAEWLERIDIATRGVDVPLSETGKERAAALGRRAELARLLTKCDRVLVLAPLSRYPGLGLLPTHVLRTPAECDRRRSASEDPAHRVRTRASSPGAATCGDRPVYKEIDQWLRVL